MRNKRYKDQQTGKKKGRSITNLQKKEEDNKREETGANETRQKE
jgi:hypothetical protein